VEREELAVTIISSRSTLPTPNPANREYGTYTIVSGYGTYITVKANMVQNMSHIRQSASMVHVQTQRIWYIYNTSEYGTYKNQANLVRLQTQRKWYMYDTSEEGTYTTENMAHIRQRMWQNTTQRIWYIYDRPGQSTALVSGKSPDIVFMCSLFARRRKSEIEARGASHQSLR